MSARPPRAQRYAILFLRRADAPVSLMAVTILNESAYFGTIQVPLSAFPGLIDAHLGEYPTTPDVEGLGVALADRDFPENRTADFVKSVCRWGRRPGIATRVLKGNLISDVCNALREATSILVSGASVARALTRVNELHGLSRLSFASKHLRFLRPDLCGVLDSILYEALPYSLDGYSNFCADCASVSKELAAKGISNPRARIGGGWFVADVEAALYMHVRDRNLNGQTAETHLE